MRKANEYVVFFDGICGLCNRSINFLLRRKNGGRFSFAPLQGQTAAERIPSELLENMGTVIYQRKDQLYTESDAALYILRDLGGFWAMGFVLIIVPPFIRNAVYRWIAKNRFSWFGKLDQCRVPTPEERVHFLP